MATDGQLKLRTKSKEFRKYARKLKHFGKDGLIDKQAKSRHTDTVMYRV